MEDAVIVAGVVDARGHENGGAPVVVQARLGVEIVDDAGGDACLALFGAHQLLHRRPALADDGFLKIVQRFGLPREVVFDVLRRGEPLRHVAGLVFQIEHHLVRHRLVEFVGVDVGAEDVLRPQLGRVLFQ